MAGLLFLITVVLAGAGIGFYNARDLVQRYASGEGPS
jgi:hypothetical protein